MSATLLDGKSLNRQILENVKQDIANLPTKPGLAVVLVGSDPASQVYVNNKEKACRSIGLYSEKIVLPDTATKEDVLAVIDRLNENPKIHGILCQFPFPAHLKTAEDEVVRRIHPQKDVDGFHPVNVGLLCSQQSHSLIPCTPKGIMRLLKEYHIDPAGKSAVVIGRSNLVGKPIALLLLAADATVTITHSKTANLKEIVQQADIVVAAIGRPRYITADMVKAGAIVIDVGINRTDSGLVGDVDFEPVSEKASFITPVPGGIGPMTIAMLIENVLHAYNLQRTKN